MALIFISTSVYLSEMYFLIHISKALSQTSVSYILCILFWMDRCDTRAGKTNHPSLLIYGLLFLVGKTQWRLNLQLQSHQTSSKFLLGEKKYFTQSVENGQYAWLHFYRLPKFYLAKKWCISSLDPINYTKSSTKVSFMVQIYMKHFNKGQNIWQKDLNKMPKDKKLLISCNICSNNWRLLWKLIIPLDKSHNMCY